MVFDLGYEPLTDVHGVEFTRIEEFSVKIKSDLILFINEQNIDLYAGKNKTFEGLRLMALSRDIPLIEAKDIEEQMNVSLASHEKKKENRIKSEVYKKWIMIQCYDYSKNTLCTMQFRILCDE